MLGFVAICALTLFPTGGHPNTPLLCIWCGERALIDSILNIGLFVPFAVGLAMAGVPWWLVALSGFGLSFAVEFLQYAVVPGRDPSLRDVVTNTLGAALGAWIGLDPGRLFRPDARQARRLVGASAIAWLALHAAGDWLTKPSFDARRIILIPRIDTPTHESFRGRLLASSILGREVLGPLESLTPEELERGQGRDGVVSASATVIPDGRETERQAPMLMLYRAPNDIQVALGQRGSALRFDVRSRATSATLRPLVFEMEGAFPTSLADGTDRTGDRLVVAAVQEPRRVRMTATSGTRARTQTLRIGPALVWVMLLPFDLPLGPATTTGSVLWLFATLLPIGYWARRATQDRNASARLTRYLALWLALAGTALVVLPIAFRVDSGSPWEWLGAAAGFAAGIALAPPCSRVPRAGRLRE